MEREREEREDPDALFSNRPNLNTNKQLQEKNVWQTRNNFLKDPSLRSEETGGGGGQRCEEERKLGGRVGF